MLYIIRHGQTALNQKRVLQGRINSLLNEEGIEQCRQAAEWFRSQGISFDLVYSSPMQRAMKTAEIVSGGACSIQTDDRLLEMDYGPYEGMGFENPPPEIMAFFMDFANTPAPEGMEQLSSVVKRTGEFLEEKRDEFRNKNVLIATHAIAMKGALEYLVPEAKGEFWPKPLANCEVFQVDITESGFTKPEPLAYK